VWKTLSSQHVENPITTHYWFVTSSHVSTHPKLSMLFGDMVFSPLLQGSHSLTSSHVSTHPKLSMLFGDMVFSPLLQGSHSHSFIALWKVASSHIWQTQSETWSTQRRHLPLWRRSNASLISESLRLWVMYSSTLISCIWKCTQTFVKNHIEKP